MISSNTVIEVLNCFLEAFIVIFYLYLLMKQDRKYPAVFMIFPTLVIFGMICMVTFCNFYPWLRLILMISSMMATSIIMFESKLRSMIFYCLLYIVVVIASEILPTIAVMLINLNDPETMSDHSLLGFIGKVCSKLFCFWFAIYIAEYLKPKQRDIPFKNWLLIIFVPLLSLVIINSIFVSYKISPRNIVNYLACVAGLFLLNIVVFDFFDTYSNTIKLQLMEQRLKSEEENYRLIEEKYTEIRRLKHDISDQLSAVKLMFSQGAEPEALDHLDKLSSTVTSAGEVCYTGISSIDAIVNMKWERSTSLNIPFSCKVVFNEKIDTDKLLLCRIIANLLDNAIEGADISHSDDKFVYISLIQNNHKLRICVMNSSDEVDSDHLATKKSGYGHGIGVSSVREAVNQLGGILSLKWEKNIFTADILIEY